MNNQDIQIGDFVQFTFSETHGILAGRTESGQVTERLGGDLLIIQSGGTECVIFAREVDKIITKLPNDENNNTDNSNSTD